MGRRAICAGALVVAGWSASVAPAQNPKDEDGKPLDLFEHALGHLDAPEPQSANASNEELRVQLDALREMVVDLQRLLDQKLVAIQQLEDENEKLRQALRLRFSAGKQGLPPVPIANRALIESVLSDAPPEPERIETLGTASAPEAFIVVSEWGRSPEVAASLPGDISSLIGMTLAVDAGTRVEALRQIGDELRENYAHYDNINIEVFDDVAAARRYANEGHLDAGRRVLTVSRFKHSGRDTITVYRAGRPVPAP
jgi:hypothetical protein